MAGLPENYVLLFSRHSAWGPPTEEIARLRFTPVDGQPKGLEVTTVEEICLQMQGLEGLYGSELTRYLTDLVDGKIQRIDWRDQVVRYWHKPEEDSPSLAIIGREKAIWVRGYNGTEMDRSAYWGLQISLLNKNGYLQSHRGLYWRSPNATYSSTSHPDRLTKLPRQSYPVIFDRNISEKLREQFGNPPTTITYHGRIFPYRLSGNDFTF